MENRKDYSKRKKRGRKRGSKQVGVKSGKIGRLLQEEEKRKQAGRSKGWKNQEACSKWKKRGSKQVEGKVENRKITPRGREEEVSG